MNIPGEMVVLIDAMLDRVADQHHVFLPLAIESKLGVAPLSSVVADFIDAEFELARSVFEGGRPSVSEGAILRAEQFYREVVERLERDDNGSADFFCGPGLV